MVTLVLKIAQVKNFLCDNVFMDKVFRNKFIDIVRMDTFHRKPSFVEIFSKDNFHLHCNVRKTITIY